MLYFSRRLFYVLSQVYLNNYLYVQSSINLVFSLVTLGFLGYYRPFRQTSILISNISGEICILSVFGASMGFLSGPTESISNVMELFIIFSVLAGMATQFMISLFGLYNAFKSTWIKIQKLRALNVIKASETQGRHSTSFI